MMKTFEFSWIDLLNKERILYPEARNAIDICISLGGYLTGGFARKFAYAYLKSIGEVIDSPRRSAKHCGDLDVWFQLSSDAMLRYDPNEHKRRGGTRFWKSFVDDVDIFFPSEDLSRGASSEIESNISFKWSSSTPAGYGHEFVLGDNLIQLITKVSGTPEDVTGGFDIANAKVWFDRHGLHVPEDWLEMERAGHLGIDRCDKTNFLWRVSKWYNKHEYSDFRSGDHAKYVDALLNAAKMTNDPAWLMWGKNVTLSQIQKKGKYFLDILAPSDLLKVSFIYDDYDKIGITHRIIKHGQEVCT